MKHTYTISGMTCNGCQAHVEETLSKVPKVASVSVDLSKNEAIIHMDEHVDISTFKKALQNSRYDIYPAGTELEHQHPLPKVGKKDHKKGDQYYCPMLCEGDKKYDQPGDCPVCGMDLEKDSSSSQRETKYTCPMHPEVIEDEPGSCTICGMDLEPMTVQKEDDGDKKAYKAMLKKFWIAVVLTLPLFIIAMGPMLGLKIEAIASRTVLGWLEFALATPVVFYTSGEFFKRGYKSVINKSPNMWTLISIGAGAAYLFSIVGLVSPDLFPPQFKTNGSVHLYFEAAAVILTLILLGQVLELKARSRTNSAIKELLNLVPAQATVIRDGEEKKVALDQVFSGDILKIKPGEKIPVDGIISKGKATIDESMITGEPVPIEKGEDDKVIGGTINGTGSFEMKAEKVGSETLLSQIIEMVNQASRSKAPIQNLADKISRYFVPTVVSISIISFAAWSIWGPEPALAYAFTNAVAVLIVACPCALGLATPMSIMVGTGRGAKQGVLVKDARAIEEMEKIDTLVIDKTGTITEGKPKFNNVESYADAFAENDILRYAASLEKSSEHPLAQAIVAGAQEKGLEPKEVTDFNSITGMGIKGRVDGKEIAIGNEKLMHEYTADVSKEQLDAAKQRQSKGETVMFVIIDSKLAGYTSVSDPIKETSAQAIKELQALGMEVHMLTGDNANTAKAVADQLHLDGFEADLLPEEKFDKVKALQNKGKKVAMAGDGINDAPALAQADVGIAMGTGTDVAIESASLTLVKGNLDGIVRARKLSEDVMKNIKQNLFFAFFYNMLGVPIAAGVLFPLFGLLLSPMLAALAMSLSSVSVIGNALRLR
ncbi:copper-translocating P-type ATPase [Fulvivirga sp. RKSG066]|uniref:heavy metal translocating P-type ATPase n=1 Tax=Fulvivirga aurantia TaxID=2529383 RepID=UPI0012BB5E8E|nr:heavy metal translocating P-type ATPase [Fulvivirga aurantia]MTI22774.1 copper-translocating P-type ATPase [Fulvivirga aurantia]